MKLHKNNEQWTQWTYKDFLKDYSLYITLVVSALIAFLGHETTLRSVRIDLGLAMAGVSSALIGIVIAGLAIFLAFIDRKYIELIDQLFGFENELLPVKATTMLAIITLLFSVGLILVGSPPTLAFRFVLLGSLWSYSYLLWQIWELVKWLIGHARARALQVKRNTSKTKLGFHDT